MAASNSRMGLEFEEILFKKMKGNYPMTELSICKLAESAGISREESRTFVHYRLRALEAAGKLKSTKIRRNTYWVTTSPGSAKLPGTL